MAHRLRPGLAGGAVVLTLAVATLVGVRSADAGPHEDTAAPAAAAMPTSRVAPTVPEDTGGGAAAFPISTAPPTGPKDSGGAAGAVPTPTAPPTGPKDTGGEYLAITAPTGCATVGPHLTVAGRARVFEAQFTVDVTQNGVVVRTAHVTASAGAPSMGTWSTVFNLAPGNYRIEAYEPATRGDGSKAATDTVWITVVAAASSSPPSS